MRPITTTVLSILLLVILSINLLSIDAIDTRDTRTRKSRDDERCICGTVRGTDPYPYAVEDDEHMSRIIEAVRDDFLDNYTAVPAFRNLEATILIREPDQSRQRSSGSGSGTRKSVWYRGMTSHASHITYPASTVKMAFMAASLHYCREKGLPMGCIDEHVRPMMVYSDNFETGVVVDLITEMPNVANLTSTSDPRWPEFLRRRSYTAHLLDRFKLLGNQIMMSKTYPTNSGAGPLGAEQVIIDNIGRNHMQSCCAASLLLDLRMGGPLLSNASAPNYATKQQLIDYCTTSLFQRRYDGHSTFGYSMPPGTLLHTKSGVAYTTVQEIAHITLPNKREAILAAYTPDGFQRGNDFGILGVFAEMLLEALGLYQGLPPIVQMRTTDPTATYTTHGTWNHVDRSQCLDCLGRGCIVSKDVDASVEWTADLPEDGLYELTVYSPTVSQATAITASVTVRHQYGTNHLSWNQRIFSRWQSLGEFFFQKGKNTITIKRAAGSAGTLSLDAIKLSKYPICNGAPGVVC